MGILRIDQRKYLNAILTKFDMNNSRPALTPIEARLHLEKELEHPETEQPYRELVGSLMYLMLGSRPDICFSLNYFSRFQSHPTTTHYNHLKRVLRYLKYTDDLELVFKREHTNQEPLLGFTDSDWAGDSTDRHSTSGHVFFVLGNCVSWCTKKQATVALSSTEAEYMALSQGACEGIYLQQVLRNFDFDKKSFILQVDNQSCIHLAKNPALHKRMKHVEIRYHFLRELVEKGQLLIQYVSSKDQKANILTKGLHLPQFQNFRKSFRLLIKGEC